jgi:hypothetical protein
VSRLPKQEPQARDCGRAWGPKRNNQVATCFPLRDTRSIRRATRLYRGLTLQGGRRGPETNALLWRIRRVAGLCWDAPQG